MQDGIKSTGAVTLAIGGVGAAFSLAACCALPLLLVSVGLSPYWVTPAAGLGERLGFCLVILSIVALAGAVFIVLRAPKTCAPGSLCVRPWFRVAIMALALLGVVLLVLAHIYA